jgi:hypothetical protein
VARTLCRPNTRLKERRVEKPTKLSNNLKTLIPFTPRDLRPMGQHDASRFEFRQPARLRHPLTDEVDHHQYAKDQHHHLRHHLAPAA